MKAAVVRAHGGPETLVFEKDFPDPRPGEGDVIVAVKASSLNYHDVFTRRGMPGIKVPMPAIMGLDVAGEIAEVGPGVTGFKKGDPVVIRSVGAYNNTQWMQFIALRPNVVMIGLDGRVEVIRKAETVEYLQQGEKIPEWLRG